MCFSVGMQPKQPPDRNLCSELVYVAPTEDTNSAPFIANLEEIAESSAVLLSEKPVRRRSKVRIISGTTYLDGIVESCIFEGLLGFFLNIQLAPESHWSPQRFTPKHFLTVKRFPVTKGLT